MAFARRWQPVLGRLRLFYRHVFPWLDALAILAWGILLVKKRLTGGLALLIHVNYFGLVFVAGWILMAIGLVLLGQRFAEQRSRRKTAATPEVRHITLFPPGVGTSLLLGAAIAGLVIPPRILGSETALQRGIAESNLPYTQTQVQSFFNPIKPEDRSLLDWVRTLNAYPEPDAYRGQTANITGFVVHSDQLPDNYLLIARFTIACCAVDASPIGLPVKLPGDRREYPPDTWLEITGTMTTETLDDRRQLVIDIESTADIEEIPTPANPYENR
ncbi:MAG: TIGR03943 family protein [Spirulinaceae cyanobacterium RM2_2_10]|nr:TIGR03943 family protein [Spirulinaceae cyanobacterium SM2_1_0]NJO18869.1 TIGR03943 family protein [Spirulinaceae cyanobacterium RM2_2_10]